MSDYAEHRSISWQLAATLMGHIAVVQLWQAGNRQCQIHHLKNQSETRR